MDTKKTLASLLEEASIPNDIKNIWLNAPRYLPPSAVLILIDALSQSSPEEIRFFSYQLKNKVDAAKRNDLHAWEKIARDELSSLNYGK